MVPYFYPTNFLRHQRFDGNHHRHRSIRGISLIEILASVTLFSLAVVGLYVASQTANRSIAEGMRTDVEAAIANLKIAEVNPYNVDVETAYDTGSTKQSVTLPDGQTVWWTRSVDSCPRPDCPSTFTADVKRIFVYLYKTENATNPYRRFKKEYAPQTMRFMLTWSGFAGHSTPAYKDAAGLTWTTISTHGNYFNSTSGGIKAGRRWPEDGGACYDGSISGGADPIPYQYHHCNPFTDPPGHLQYVIPVSKDYTYQVTLGFAEPGSAALGARLIGVEINGETKETLDILSQTSADTAISRSYPGIVPTLVSGVYAIQIRLLKSGTATPVISNITVSRE